MPVSFVHLQVHSEYSLLSALPTVRELVAQAARLRLPALALTDFGNLFGAIEFYTEAMRAGIKPILGMEAYLCADHTAKDPSGSRAPVYPRVVLLARNMRGWKNLIRLSSLGYLEGFYWRPRIDHAQLAAHADGLVAITSGWHGEIEQLIRAGRTSEAEARARWYREVFGSRFFIAVQRTGVEGQEELNERMVELARRHDIPLVATNDVHMLHPSDYEIYRTMLRIQPAGRSDEETVNVTEECFLRAPEIMAEDLFGDLPEAVANTVAIARMCNVDLPFGQYQLPEVEPPEGLTQEDYLRRLAYEGLDARWPEITARNPKAKRADYEQRLDFELATIARMGYVGYFLIVADFIRWAKAQKIPVGPGRGSGAGSLVAYCLGITNLDPIRYGLLFERFLNPERVSMPDFDIDFCMHRRDEVIDYVTARYGRERVAQIITFGAMKARAVIRDVGRALGVPLTKVDRIARLVPNSLSMTLERALAEEPQLVELMEKDPEVKRLIEIALRLEGHKRNASKHAAGVIIAQKPLMETAPLYRAPSEDEVVVQWDMKHAEKVGLVKFDFLGLKTLTVIDRAERIVREHFDPEFSIERIPLDDPETFKLYREGRTYGVFQVESAGMRNLLMRLAPDCFEDLIAVVALYRPGPLQSGMVDAYIRRKHGEEPVHYPHPKLKPILEETYGVIVYQEQVMQIAQVLAGYTLGQADLLRRAMGKKIPEEMARQRAVFVDGAEKRGLERAKAEEIFDLMEKFAEYGFNKSHSAAYALVSYQTAYLKAHYPLAFMAATMSCEMHSTDKLAQLVRECRAMGIEVRPPDVNRSRWDFAPEEGGIRYALAAIKGVGEAAARAIEKARSEGGPFEDLVDFLARVPDEAANRRVVEALIKAGAMDALVPHRAAGLAALEQARAIAARRRQMRGMAQGALFAEVGDGGESLRWDAPPWDAHTRLAAEAEALGFYLAEHPLVRKLAPIASVPKRRFAELGDVGDGDLVWLPVWVRDVRVRGAKSGRMAFLVAEDGEAQRELVCFPSVWERVADKVKPDAPLWVEARPDRSRGEMQLIVEEVLSWDEMLRTRTQEVVIASEAACWDETARQLLAERRGKGRAKIRLRLRAARAEVEMCSKDGFLVDEALLDWVAERLGTERVQVSLAG